MGSVEKAFTFYFLLYVRLSCNQFLAQHFLAFSLQKRQAQDSAFIQFCIYSATIPASLAENLSI